MTIWLDVTSTLRWSRPAVGIIRTEVELIRSSFDKDFKYFRLDNPGGSPSEVSKESLKLALKSLEAFTSPQGRSVWLSLVTAKPQGTTLQKLRWRSFAFYSILSPRQKGIASKFVNAIRAMLKLRPTKSHESNGLHECSRRCPWSIFSDSPYLIFSGFMWEFLDPKNIAPTKKVHNFKVASMVYDTIPAKFPEYAPKGFDEKFRSYLVGLLGIADKIFTISRTSEADILDFCRLNKISLASKIAVLTLGCDIQSIPAAVDSSRALKPQGYFLYVSTLEVRKNHEILYRAFRRMVIESPSSVPKLVFVGMPGWNVQELFEEIAKDSLLSQPSMNPKLVILEKVSDTELAWLYRNAIATLFPSHYEGWGLPIAESLSVGTPVVTSNAGACVEAGQGRAVLINADDLEGWKAAMNAFIDEPGYRERLLEPIKSYRAPTWEAFSESVFSELK